MKRSLSEFKIILSLKDRKLKKDESIALLLPIVKKKWDIIEDKNKKNKVINNYIKPKIKNISQEINEELKF